MLLPALFIRYSRGFVVGVIVLLAGIVAGGGEEASTAPVVTNDSAVWLPIYGEKMFDHQHPDWEGWFPGGRNNRFHDLYVQSVWQRAPITKDWKISNRAYVFDGEWFAVEWFYRATYTDDGFREWESTLGIGRLVDGKMILWTEYFDDSVGNLQRLRLMPLFEADEPVFPWPQKAVIRIPYRP
jgi:hypothetical protein